ncbi:MAG: hypothetical protein ACM3VT_14575, partial [Solirubrobacterales bacterium]
YPQGEGGGPDAEQGSSVDDGRHSVADVCDGGLLGRTAMRARANVELFAFLSAGIHKAINASLEAVRTGLR